MNKLLALFLISLMGCAQAATLSISCQNSVATFPDGRNVIVKQSSLSSNGDESILKMDETVNSLPPLRKAEMGYITGAKYKNGSVMTVAVVDSPVPNAASLMVKIKDENDSPVWSMLAAGCRTLKGVNR